MTDLFTRLASWFPLAQIAVLAILVAGAWLFWGAGPIRPRLWAGVSWLAVLILSWVLLLYREERPREQDDALMWITFLVTIASFFVPWLLKRITGKKGRPHKVERDSTE